MNLFSLITLFIFMILSIPAYAAPASPGKDRLTATFKSLEQKLAKNQFNMPISLESAETGSASSVDIHGILDFPFDMVQKALIQPASWCDITMLHTNVRACIWKQNGTTTSLILYTVKKNTRPIEDALQMPFSFQVVRQQDDFVALVLSSDEGAYGTRDHTFHLEAMPLDNSRTFLHLRYSFKYSTLGYIGMKSYFALFSRGHVGFTITGWDSGKKPIYAKGLKGAIERNSMRYYLGILAFMETLNLPPEQQSEKRINRWFDLGERYRRQLHAMERKEYLAHKRQDQQNRKRLQASQ